MPALVKIRPWAVLLAVALLLSVGLQTVLAEDRNVREFATGSGKTEAATVDSHLSFTAHSVPGGSGQCPAKGSIVYKQQTGAGDLHVKADVIRLVIQPNVPVGGARAFMVGEIQSATLNGQPIATAAFGWWDAVDSGMQGGTGDQIRFEGFVTTSPCLIPLFGTPITSGNVVIEAEPTIVNPF
jgi:hypothetical protein